MTKAERIEKITAMNRLDVNLDLGYEIYQDEESGDLYEVDYDEGEVVRIWELDSNGVAQKELPL